MDEAPGPSDQYRTASLWPVFTALGIPVSESDPLFGLFPLAVGELLLFGGNVIGILKEFGYATSTIRIVTALAVVFPAFGAGLAFTDIALVTRSYAVIAAAILLAVGGVASGPFVREQRQTS